MFMKRFLAVFVVGVFLALPLTAFAAGYVQSSIILPAGSVIDDNFVRAGQTVEINGDVRGDLIIAGQTIIVNGAVGGDVLAAGETVEIHGPVSGNVRVAASTVTVDAVVGKNVTIFANTATITSKAAVGWSMQAFGASLDLSGVVTGNLNYYGSAATVRGNVNGNAKFVLGDQGALRLTATSKLAKDLDYHSNREAAIDTGATVSGTVRMIRPAPHESPWRSYAGSLLSLWRLVNLFGLLVVGLVILSLLPKSTARITKRMAEQAGRSIGWGVIVLVATPILVGLLFFTLIGFPLGLLLLALFVVVLYISQIFVGMWLGQWVLGRLAPKRKFAPLWSLIVGVVLLTILRLIPFLGWLVGLIGILWTLGSMTLEKWDQIRLTEKA